MLTFTVACGAPPPPCPAGLTADPPRVQRLVAQLAEVPESAAILRRLPRGAPRVCFGRVPVSALTDDGVVLLDTASPDAEAAARLGHLALHAIAGSPAPHPGSPDCDAAVARALTLEARAFALELRLRRALGVTSIRYGFEEAYWQASPEAREPAILAWLTAHPSGGQGVDALGDGYRRRCEGR
ncbi:hypothetical protein [Chondromyces apiculatus]|uniref:Uncharacterized protein n=1 Tax=Chondromyces apiculatus DSM 436 TaxID=1192034 RepID=A0A017T317_9BACT|nr:hypothetical protein [Chondromyces apiculatus]EYF03629.1 Hypothetical protein CAP_5420 [Chondromyces apiculatus DSM 436]